jgi:hypothetical protein
VLFLTRCSVLYLYNYFRRLKLNEFIHDFAFNNHCNVGSNDLVGKMIRYFGLIETADICVYSSGSDVNREE